jgi:sec-independent protein translocase protein TatA
MFRNPLIDAIVVLVVVLLIFGPKRLPLLGRSLGQGMREFKESITGSSKSDDEEERPALTQSTAQPAPSQPAASAVPTTERESAELGSRESGS